MKARTMVFFGAALLLASVMWIRWETSSPSEIIALDYGSGIGLREPCKVIDIGWFLDGGTIGGLIRDADGRKVPFCLDGGMRSPEYEEQPRLAYLGADHPGSEGAFPVPLCSRGELELIRLLSDWVDTEIPRSDRARFYAIYRDYSIPPEERMKRLPGLTATQQRALETLRVVDTLAKQREAFGCGVDSATTGL